MQDKPLMSVGDSLGEGGYQCRCLGGRDSALLLFEPLGKGRSIAIGRRNVGNGADLLRFIDRDQVRMIENGGSLGLAEEALAQCGCNQDFRTRHFEGHVASQYGVKGMKDDAAAAPAQFFLDQEAAEM